MHDPRPQPESDWRSVGASFHFWPSRYCTVSASFARITWTSDTFRILIVPDTVSFRPKRCTTRASFHTSTLGCPGGGEPEHACSRLTLASCGLAQAVVA